jgi:RNA polymerase sigma-70 factor, ECF subfamily
MADSTERQDALYERVATVYGPALDRLAHAYEGDSDRRRDLLQEIHVALWRSLRVFDERCSLRTWVYRVAHNVATSQIVRRRTHAPTLVTLDELATIAAENDAEQALDRRMALERLAALIRTMKPLLATSGGVNTLRRSACQSTTFATGLVRWR